MPQVDLESLVCGVSGAGAGAGDRKVSCETVIAGGSGDASPPPDPDLPPESITIPIGDDAAFSELNPIYERDDSTKGSTNPKFAAAAAAARWSRGRPRCPALARSCPTGSGTDGAGAGGGTAWPPCSGATAAPVCPAARPGRRWRWRTMPGGGGSSSSSRAALRECGGSSPGEEPHRGETRRWPRRRRGPTRTRGRRRRNPTARTLCSGPGGR
uniref:Uncharacterized protein n=1 Tax=Zea mays TaxID=4577 RepID=C0P646_MAIZE|nr:unknown [Zea mays]